MIIYAVLSHLDFVAKFTVKNLNKDFTNTVGKGGGGPPFCETCSEIHVTFLTLMEKQIVTV